VSKAGAEEEETEEGGSTDEYKEVAIVTATDTVVQPDAVMILGFDAVVANTTMVRTWGPPDIAAFAVFGRDFHSSIAACGRYHHCPFRGRRTKTQRVFIRISWRKWM
jgi:hypothetical protein